MTEWLSGSNLFALLLTLAAYELGRSCQQRWKSPLLNPILIGACLTAAILMVIGIPNSDYQRSIEPLQLLLTPATICFAIPFYSHLKALKKDLLAICTGTLIGVITSLGLIISMAKLFRLEEVMLWSLLPKSVTTAIGVALSEAGGGIPAVTTSAIIATGILGNLCGPALCRLFRLDHPVAQGVALGTSSHAIGTSRARQMCELAGAVSSFALTLAGLLTALILSVLCGE